MAHIVIQDENHEHPYEGFQNPHLSVRREKDWCTGLRDIICLLVFSTLQKILQRRFLTLHAHSQISQTRIYELFHMGDAGTHRSWWVLKKPKSSFWFRLTSSGIWTSLYRKIMAYYLSRAHSQSWILILLLFFFQKMHYYAVNFVFYVSFLRGSKRKQNIQKKKGHFERSSLFCFRPFPETTFLERQKKEKKKKEEKEENISLQFLLSVHCSWIRFSSAFPTSVIETGPPQPSPRRFGAGCVTISDWLRKGLLFYFWKKPFGFFFSE